MKVTLDLDDLLQRGEITALERDRLARLAAASTGSLAFNLFVAFGIVAVSAAALAMVPAPVTAILIGLGVLAGGLLVLRANLPQWRLLANICILVGALMAGGGTVVAGNGSLASLFTVTIAFALVAVVARSTLMAVLATLMLGSCLGARNGYGHASYGLQITQPVYTILLFAALAIGLQRLSPRLAATHRRLAEAAMRTAIFLINFGFWVGSLWGERLGHTLGHGPIGPVWFAVLWAVALLAAGVWAWRRNQRWVLNTVAVFAAIDLYTQWFENLQASPATVLAAGLMALAIAPLLRFANARMKSSAAA